MIDSAELAQLKEPKGANIDGILDYSDHEADDVTSASNNLTIMTVGVKLEFSIHEASQFER